MAGAADALDGSGTKEVGEARDAVLLALLDVEARMNELTRWIVHDTCAVRSVGDDSWQMSPAGGVGRLEISVFVGRDAGRMILPAPHHYFGAGRSAGLMHRRGQGSRG